MIGSHYENCTVSINRLIIKYKTDGKNDFVHGNSYVKTYIRFYFCKK